MTTFETLDKQNFVTLSETEMMETEGGAWPIVVWIAANPVTAAKIAGGVAAVGIAGYHILTGN